MTGIDGVHLLAGSTVGGVEIMTAHGVALQSDTKQFGLEAVLYAIQLLLHNLIERGSQDFAVLLALYGHVLASIVYPDVHDTGIVLRLTHGVGDTTATLGVLNPEVADGLIGVRKSETTALGV